MAFKISGYKEIADSPLNCQSCFFSKGAFCTLGQVKCNQESTCDNWTGREVVEVQEPYGYLIWKGSKTAIVSPTEIPEQTDLALISGKNIFGNIRLGKGIHINLSEFRRREIEHRVFENERKTMWPDADAFIVYQIDKFTPLLKSGYESSLPIAKKADGWELIVHSEDEESLISKAKKLPRTIEIIPDVVVLGKDGQVFSNCNNCMSTGLQSKVKSLFDIEVKEAGFDGRGLGIYSLALVRNPRMAFEDIKIQVSEKAFDESDWDGSASNWDTAEEYCSDCLIDVNPTGEEKTKTLCKLPYRKPGSDSPNVNAIRAIGGGRGFSALVKPDEVDQETWDNKVAAAAKKVINWWPQIFDNSAPDTVYEAAGETPPTEERMKKEMSLQQTIQKIQEAFTKQYGWEYFVIETFMDYIVVYCEMDEGYDKLYKVPFTEGEEMIEFSPMDEWVEVEHTYMPKMKNTGLLDWIKGLFTKRNGGAKELLEFSGNFAVKRIDGQDWYMTKSTNAFIDREEEIFSTKALVDFAKRAMEKDEGNRGTFDIWHIPGTDFAEKRFIAVIGKFLFEAGPFFDNEFGEAAKTFFKTHKDGHPDIAPEGWGCSPEFKFLPEDREDGVYDWLHIVKTSTLPISAAANIYTKGGTIVNKLEGDQLKMAQAIFGEELIDSIQARLLKETDQLVEDGIASKEKVDGEPSEPIEDAKTGEPTKVEDLEIEIPVDDIANRVKALIEVDTEPIIQGMLALAEQVSEIKSAVEGMKAEMEDVKETKMPRYKLSFMRASESPATEVKEEDAKTIDKVGNPPNAAGSGAANFFPSK